MITDTSAVRIEPILGFDVYSCTSDDLIDEITQVVTQQLTLPSQYLACFNPHSYAVSKTDALFAAALSKANWLVPDGVGTLLASKILAGRIRSRITGADVFLGLHRRLEATRTCTRIFFCGSSEENLKAIAVRMAADYPSLQVVGLYSPPYRSTYAAPEIEAIVSAINAARPDVLWVGMTAPKQEKWIAENIERLNVRFIGAIGAVFDFYTGQVTRPSRLYRSLGLEWLPRLLREPRRLWRRTFISAPIFLMDVLVDRLAMASEADGSTQ